MLLAVILPLAIVQSNVQPILERDTPICPVLKTALQIIFQYMMVLIAVFFVTFYAKSPSLFLMLSFVGVSYFAFICYVPYVLY